MLEILRPMAIAHKQTPPIVHRDLKPQNILVARSDCFPPKLKIADLGIGGLSVRASIATSKVGRRFDRNIIGWTHAYASQEQMDDEDRKPNPSDDVHALGVIWCELLSGKLLKGRPSGIGWRKRLAERGMTPQQLELLQSCCDEEENRPKDAAALMEIVRQMIPSFSDEVQKDIDEIARLKKAGDDWRGYVKKVHDERIQIWASAANELDSNARWLLGQCSEMGIGRTKLWEPDHRLRQAASYYLRAARNGCSEAQYSLACYNRLGFHDQMDGMDHDEIAKHKENSHNWLMEAVKGGQIDAMYEFGLQLIASEDWWTRLEGMKRLLKAANEGHIEAQLWYVRQRILDSKPMGMDYSEQNDWRCQMDHVSEDQCRSWLVGAASKGHVEAQFLLGQCNAKGLIYIWKSDSDRIVEQITPPNVDEAIKWYRKAANRGHLKSQFRLSQCRVLPVGV